MFGFFFEVFIFGGVGILVFFFILSSLLVKICSRSFFRVIFMFFKAYLAFYWGCFFFLGRGELLGVWIM